MADNYLEKRMDDYRRGAKTYRPKLTPTGHKVGEVTLRFTPKRILVTMPLSPITEAVIREFTAVGCKVAFFSEDKKEGNKMAQSTGSRCFPVRIQDTGRVSEAVDALVHDWGDIDILIAGSDCKSPYGCDPSDVPLSESVFDLLPPDRFYKSLQYTFLPFYTVLRKLMMFRYSRCVANPYGRVILIGPQSSFEAQLLTRLRAGLESLSIRSETISPEFEPGEISRSALLFALR